MQATKETNQEHYQSGFPKSVQRSKYNLVLNKQLKVARKRKKFSSAAVVHALNEKGVQIGNSTLWGYEADESNLNHRYPSIPTLLALAEFYGCSLDYLFGLTDKFKPSPYGPKEYDIYDLLDRDTGVYYKDVRLNKKQRQDIIRKIDLYMAKIAKQKAGK